MTKKRVAVLGGGVAALTTAFELTSSEALREQYDVTVYQLGWRLGGKGASGRNADAAQRIEEHGLHIWMGFYQNAFRLMRDAYRDLGRPEGAELRGWKDAFHQHSYIVLMEQMRERMEAWTFDFKTNGEEPGGDHELPSPLAYVQMVVQLLWDLWESELGRPYHARIEAHHVPLDAEAHALLATNVCLDQELCKVDHARGIGTCLSPTLPPQSHVVSERARQVMQLVHEAHARPELSFEPRRAAARVLMQLADAVRAAIGEPPQDSLHARKLWVGVSMAAATAAGLLCELHGDDWDALDTLDLRAWMKKHGADPLTLESGPMRGIYDLVFGYIGGDTKRGAFAAGTALRGMLRMVFTYHGSIFYRMQAGMGDVVAMPLYEVLKARGVKFEFFHRVTHVALDASHTNVARVDFRKQVALNAEHYDPIVRVKGLSCWPSAPLFDQIVDGEGLRAAGIDLESSWAPLWKGGSERSIELGKDFDKVVLGIAIGGLPDVARELIDAYPALAQSVERVGTVRTQALQLWLDTSTHELGWDTPRGVHEAPVLGGFTEPIDTWADMSDLLKREDWKLEPKSLAYFCGPFRDDAQPPYSDSEYPRHELRAYKELVERFLETQAWGLWPKVAHRGGFAWQHLVDPQNREGMQRLDAQYLRVNIDPSERYVLSLPGSTTYRLRAAQLPIENLVLSGDWTYNGLNAGCVEAAVMGGMLASRALCGWPRVIVGLPKDG